MKTTRVEELIKLEALPKNVQCQIIERASYTIKFEDLLTVRDQAIKDNKEPIFLFEFKDKGRYVVAFCEKECMEEAFINFDTTDKSYLVKESDLRNMSSKFKGPILGIKFTRKLFTVEDRDFNVPQYIIIQDYSKWQKSKRKVNK